MHTTSSGRVAWQSTSDGENSYSHWAARRPRGRSRRAGSGRQKTGRIGFLGAEPPTLLARADEVME